MPNSNSYGCPQCILQSMNLTHAKICHHSFLSPAASAHICLSILTSFLMSVSTSHSISQTLIINLPLKKRLFLRANIKVVLVVSISCSNLYYLTSMDAGLTNCVHVMQSTTQSILRVIVFG